MIGAVEVAVTLFGDAPVDVIAAAGIVEVGLVRSEGGGVPKFLPREVEEHALDFAQGLGRALAEYAETAVYVFVEVFQQVAAGLGQPVADVVVQFELKLVEGGLNFRVRDRKSTRLNSSHL